VVISRRQKAARKKPYNLKMDTGDKEDREDKRKICIKNFVK
jgi:hypothetical protein